MRQTPLPTKKKPNGSKRHRTRQFSMNVIKMCKEVREKRKIGAETGESLEYVTDKLFYYIILSQHCYHYYRDLITTRLYYKVVIKITNHCYHVTIPIGLSLPSHYRVSTGYCWGFNRYVPLNGSS